MIPGKGNAMLGAMSPGLNETMTSAEISAQHQGGAPESHMNTVIVLDWTRNMSKSQKTKACELVKEFLHGLEDNSFEHALEEKVALAYFDNEPKIVQHFTYDYQKIRDALNGQIPTGGDEKPVAEILLTIADNLLKCCKQPEGNEVPPRVILLFSGWISFLNEIQIKLIQELMMRYRLKVYSVPLGPKNETVKKLMMKFNEFIYEVKPENIKSLCRTYIHHKIAGAVMDKKNITKDTIREASLRLFPRLQVQEQDLENAFKIYKDNLQKCDTDKTQKPTAYVQPHSSSMTHAEYTKQISVPGPDSLPNKANKLALLDEVDAATVNYAPIKHNLPIMPHAGFRVTTGPDWIWRQNDVEIDEEGEVLSSRVDGWVKVKWDKGVVEEYRYGLDNEFDIVPVNGGMSAVKWRK